MPAFKVGDRVRVIRPYPHPGYGILMGVEGNIIEIDPHDGHIKINTKPQHYWNPDRFELIVPAAPVARPFQVGDEVKVVKKVEKANDVRCMWAPEMEGYLNDGVEYIIREMYDGGKTAYLNTGWYFLTECLIHADGAPAVVKEHPVLKAEDFKVGDKAIIVRKVERDGLRWNPEMDKMLNDGKKYVVKSITATGKLRLDNGWLYLPDSLAIAEKKKPKPKKPKKPKLRSLRSVLREKIATKAGGICSFAMQTEDGEQNFQMGGPCHAALSYAIDSDKKVTQLVYGLSHETVHMQTKKFLKEHKGFLQYMLNESPWAKCFITKSPAVAYRYEIEMDVTQSRHHIAGACIAMRQGSEYAHIMLPMFKKMKDKGYSGHTAFIMGCAFMASGDGYVRNGLNGGHSILYIYMNAKQMFKTFREGFHIKTDGKPFSAYRTGYSVFKHMASESDTNFNTWLDKNVELTVRGEGFRAIRTITEASLFAVADKIEKLVTKGEE